MNDLERKIETLLFYKNEPLSMSWLSKKLSVSEKDILETIEHMSSFYEGRGIQLITTADSVALVTHRDFTSLIQDIKKNKDEKELSKQALETLSIIAYKDGVTKSEIDYIRGVNSVFILRNLLIRGLIEKKVNPEDKRSPLYIPTHNFFSFLGIERYSDLPGYNEAKKNLESIQDEFIREKEANL